MNEFTGIATSTLQSWLTAAQSAMQELAIGKKVVRLQTGEKMINFTAAELPQLRSYILRLQKAIAIAEGTVSSQPYSVATWTR
jgi:hypothetical protein